MERNTHRIELKHLTYDDDDDGWEVVFHSSCDNQHFREKLLVQRTKFSQLLKCISTSIEHIWMSAYECLLCWICPVFSCLCMAFENMCIKYSICCIYPTHLVGATFRIIEFGSIESFRLCWLFFAIQIVLCVSVRISFCLPPPSLSLLTTPFFYLFKYSSARSQISHQSHCLAYSKIIRLKIYDAGNIA